MATLPPRKPTRKSLAALVEHFTSTAALTSSDTNARIITRIVQRFMRDCRIKRPADIDAAVVEDWLTGQRREGRALATLHNYRTAVSVFCQHLATRGLLDANPCEKIRLPKIPERLPVFFTAEETPELIRLAAKHRMCAEVALGLFTGLRLGEMMRLRWEDIDFRRHLLLVKKSKSGRVRAVPLSEKATITLEEQQTRTGQFAYVFPGRHTWRGGWRYENRQRGKHWWMEAMNSLRQDVPKFAEAGDDRCAGRGWHALRHSFASRAAQEGVSIYKIAGWLGHTNVKMTMRYAHLAGAYDADVERIF